MSELRRWLEDAPPSEVQRLLEAGQWARPSGALLDQTLLRVRAGAAADPLDAALPPDQGGALRTGIKWSVVGALLLGGIGALTFGLRPHEAASSAVSPSERAPVAPAVPTALRPIVQSEAAHASSPSSTPELTPPQSVKPAPERPRSVAAPPAAPARASDSAAHAKVCKPGVVDQINMLEQAKGLIQRGRGAEALAILDRYDAFGAGRCFVPESMKHRMDAYAQTGNANGAARTASSIKKQYPDTAQARAADAVLKQK